MKEAAQIDRIVVLGAGSAGLMSAMAIRRAFPSLAVTIVSSSNIPIIGVGESTTVLLPPFLHQSLGLNFQEFFQNVQTSWKLGVKFVWGDPKDSHFNYPFDSCMSSKPAHLAKMPTYHCMHDWSAASSCWELMDKGLSPCFHDGKGNISLSDAFGYHIENRSFVAYLQKNAVSLGIEFVDGEFSTVKADQDGCIESIALTDGRTIEGDLFVDCSGFQSKLLAEQMKSPFVSYEDSLFCDRAVVGSWQRTDEAIQPYTTAETMNNGWCWRIDFPDHITRGYVFSSAFCSDDQAIQEFRAVNPKIGDDLRVIQFSSGRYEKFWMKNVVAIGNSCGFVEPLEATALHLVVEQVRLLCRILSETDLRVVPALRDVANRQFALLWDEVRDFLAIHYRFNRKSDSAFWQHCRTNTNLGGATDFVNLYQEAGPSSLCATLLPSGYMFGYDGFMALLIGQRVPTKFSWQPGDEDQKRWSYHQDQIRNRAKNALSMQQALQHVLSKKPN